MDQPAIDEDARVKLVRSLWLVAAAMTVHELEEWNIASWGARNFENHTGISQEAIWIGILLMTVVFVSWIFLATRLRSPLAISLAALPAVALVAVGNSVQHITWAFLFGEYAPGVVSAVLLVLPASGLAMWNMLQQSRLLAIPMVACVALWVASSVQIVDAGHVLQPFQLVLHRFFISMTTALGLPGVGGAV